jgi:hypothetical protein
MDGLIVSQGSQLTIVAPFVLFYYLEEKRLKTTAVRIDWRQGVQAPMNG